MAGQISVSLEGKIATVTISQPGKRNALTVEMWGELKSAFEKAGADATLRCIVLRGDGDEAFSAGADMSEFERVRSTREQVIEFHESCVRGALTAILECPIPVVAAIGGVCMGGGWKSPPSATCESAVNPPGSARRWGDTGSRWRLQRRRRCSASSGRRRWPNFCWKVASSMRAKPLRRALSPASYPMLNSHRKRTLPRGAFARTARSPRDLTSSRSGG